MAVRNKELYQRGEIWWYRFTNPRTSEQTRESAKTTDRVLAQKKLDEAKASAWVDATTNTDLAQSHKLWIEATIKWLEVKTAKRSLRDDRVKIDILAPVLDEIFLKDINDEFIRTKVVNGLLKKRHISPATTNRYLDLIRSILKASERWEWLEKVPHITKPGKEGERQRKAWITVEQFKRAHEAMSPLKADMMLLSLCTGLRASNVATLQHSEVDIPNKRITIPASKFKGKVDHTVPLNKTAVQLLQKRLDDHSEAVFVCNGNPVKGISLLGWHQVFDELGVNAELRNAGLLSKKKNDKGEFSERFVFHGMRHTFATWLRRNGVPIDIIETIGGWSKGGKNKMVNMYTHIDDVSYLLPYVRIIDSILDGKKKV